MVLSLMSVTVFAVTSVNFTIDEPVAGSPLPSEATVGNIPGAEANVTYVTSASLSYPVPAAGSYIADFLFKDITCPADALYECDGLCWCIKNADGSYSRVAGEERFNSETTYYAQFRIHARGDGVVLADSLISNLDNITVNGNLHPVDGAHVNETKTQATFYVEQPLKVPETALKSLEGSITFPVIGNKPSFSVNVPQGANYTAKINEIYTETEYNVGPEDTFAEGIEYCFSIRFKANEGYKLPQSTSDIRNTGIVIKDEKGNVLTHMNTTYVPDTEELQLNVFLNAAKPEPIVLTSFDGIITAPVGGSKPVYKVKVPNNANYTAVITEFRDFYYEETIGPKDTFTAGEKYLFFVKFTANEGYKVPENVRNAEFLLEDENGNRIEGSPYYDSSDDTFNIEAKITAGEAPITEPENERPRPGHHHDSDDKETVIPAPVIKPETVIKPSMNPSTGANI